MNATNSGRSIRLAGSPIVHMKQTELDAFSRVRHDFEVRHRGRINAFLSREELSSRPLNDYGGKFSAVFVTIMR